MQNVTNVNNDSKLSRTNSFGLNPVDNAPKAIRRRETRPSQLQRQPRDSFQEEMQHQHRQQRRRSVDLDMVSAQGSLTKQSIGQISNKVEKIVHQRLAAAGIGQNLQKFLYGTIAMPLFATLLQRAQHTAVLLGRWKHGAREHHVTANLSRSFSAGLTNANGGWSSWGDDSPSASPL